MADVEFENVTHEVKGVVYPGRLRLRENEIMFRNDKTGKVEHFQRVELESAEWIARATGLGLRVKLKDDSLHRYDGFGELEADKLAKFFKTYFSIDITKRELCYKGFNWGDVSVHSDVLELSIKNSMVLELPLGNVSNATVNKNELVFEFHLNDDSEICLSEMRFFTPGTEVDKEGIAPEIYERVTEKADIIQVTGDFLVEFKQLQCLQPRGRYDVKLYPTFIHLHGKSFDFKIPKITVMRLLMLPHPDNRQTFFVVQLDPPIKHGQTRYYFAIFLFDLNSHVDLEMTVTDEWLQEHLGGKLTQNISGPEYEVVARVFKALYDQKVTIPGAFTAKGGGHAVACSYKASVGLLYPLERGFTFVPRPPVSIRFDEIISVQFSRGTGAQRSFDFEVETRSGTTHTFTSIERNEYHQLYDFVISKKLRVKNIESESKAGANLNSADVWSSSDESHDAYMEKVKTEARKREVEMDEDDDDEEDEDFQPPESEGSEIAEEYDSNVQTTSSEENSDDGKSGSISSSSVKEAKRKKVRDETAKERSNPKTRPERKTKKSKRVKDPNAPTRPPTAYLMWFNQHREEIAKTVGGNSVAEVAKAAGEKWRNMDSEAKSIYQSKVDELKKKYDEEMRIYRDKLGSGELKSSEKTVSSQKATGKSPKKAVTSSSFKSKEFIASSDSDSLSSLSGQESKAADGNESDSSN